MYQHDSTGRIYMQFYVCSVCANVCANNSRSAKFLWNWAKISGISQDDLIAFYCCRKHHIAIKTLLTFVKSQQTLPAPVTYSHTNCTTERNDNNRAFTILQTANSCAAEITMNCTSSLPNVRTDVAREIGLRLTDQLQIALIWERTVVSSKCFQLQKPHSQKLHK